MPLKAVNYTEQLQGSGYDTNSVQLVVRIEKSSTTSLATALTKKGGTLVGNAYDFSVSLLLGNVERTVSEFDSYVERSISVNSSGLTASELTVVRLDAESGDATYVPTSTETASGKIKVKFSRKGNSVYAVMRKAPLVYSDMTKHWAKADVSKLAAKFIVSGINSTQYKPEQAITRAEFAEYIARGLGLTGDKSVVTSKYKDVPATGASAAFIGAASKAGIVSGGTDGKFRPNASITREEMASMLVRAMKYAGVSTTASSTALNKFTDRAKVGSWAKDGVAACVQAGIISGVTPTTIKPQNNAKRSEAASMITRFLKYVDLLEA
ncbi:S-layer homology domain-containing protein [Cohnella faecalis]|uniref:S-layer homology domain-containing protein n=1 Tax=Cohnella faecalis TaxID=2315694 RepID=UPI0011C2366E|nr:S-layer homology domain-containing protein [Cohnella faecalis]